MNVPGTHAGVGYGVGYGSVGCEVGALLGAALGLCGLGAAAGAEEPSSAAERLLLKLVAPAPWHFSLTQASHCGPLRT